MIIKVPEWITEIKDEHQALFAWFADRVCRLHGYDVQYQIHPDDVIRMTNRRGLGIVEWLRKVPAINSRMRVGDVSDHIITFEMRKPEKGAHIRSGRPAAEAFFDYQLEDTRAQHVYMYLLGCLNSNFLSEDPFLHNKCFKWNTYGIPEFHLTREPQAYIKIADRPVE